MSVAATSNILLIKLSAIGDLVMATPAIHALRELHPQAQIALLVGRWARPVIDGNPDLDEIIEIDESIFWKPKPFALLRLLLRLRGRHFTHGYNLHWSNLFNLFLLLLGIPERAGFSRDGRARFLTHSAPFTEGERGSHAIDHYLCLVTNEPQRFDRQPRIYLRDTERRIGVVKLSALRGDAASPVIAIAPGGGENPKSAMPLRRWPRERFVELARLIL
ncbi:MAG: glycosyltransferase family 9 protein, partial [Vicinamibacteria bacterium]|nr:glycosyltransferase family 9 protein [Vicinamibacteria bacterium]